MEALAGLVGLAALAASVELVEPAEPVETESDIMPAKLVFDYLLRNIFLRERFPVDAFMLRALLPGAGEPALVLAVAWKYP